MVLLLGFAFLSGLVTIFSPCIWPVLPIVLSSSVVGKADRKKALGITLGIILSFTLFTLAVSSLVRVFGFDPNILRFFAVLVIGFLGITMIVPGLLAKFESFISYFSSSWEGNKIQNRSGFIQGIITGLSLGVVWSPCAGPILASIAALAATGNVSLDVILITLMYVTGVGIPLFVFSYGGQQLILRTKRLSRYTGVIQRIFGIVMIITALFIYTNKDKDIQIILINRFPILSSALNGFENNPIVTEELNKLKGNTTPSLIVNPFGLFNTNTPSPEFAGINKWLNSETSLTMAGLKGKVVLVDFWTYTCINCIRTLPHVTGWYDKYKDKGLVVIGVHTPEFIFEKNTGNVLSAIRQYNIHYPVAQDNDYVTWNAFNNQYWPAEYLIDGNGIIRRTHFGEGEYDKMEEAIQELLKDSGQKIDTTLTTMPDKTPTKNLSPETYLGSKRMEYLSKIGQVGNGKQNFTIDKNLQPDHFSYGGEWDISDEYAVSGSSSVLDYRFNANKVFLIMNPGTEKGRVSVYLDGKPIDSRTSGNDVKEGVITVDTDRLYDVVNLSQSESDHLLHLEFTPGIKIYTFTFGE